MKSWRFLNTGFRDGYTNMAIDEVLVKKSVPNDKRPIFRVYGWEPYAISLGYNQDPSELNLEKCKADKIDVVRRPTGGRAVLHAEEITYSVVVPRESEFYTNDILTTYNMISTGLLKGLHLIGVKAELVERTADGNEKSAAYKNDVPCFSSSAKYEIAYKNRKLVGSAQRRFDTSILQHGSILVGHYHLKIAEYICAIKEHQIEKFQIAMNQKTICISQILSEKLNYDKIIWAIKTGFQQSFNIHFFEGQLTPQENAEVAKLVPKYQNLGGKR